MYLLEQIISNKNLNIFLLNIWNTFSVHLPFTRGYLWIQLLVVGACQPKMYDTPIEKILVIYIDVLRLSSIENYKFQLAIRILKDIV